MGPARVLAVGLLLALGACGDDSDGAKDEGGAGMDAPEMYVLDGAAILRARGANGTSSGMLGFSATFQAAIIKDCRESLLCISRRGTDVPEATFDECVNGGSQALDNDIADQGVFQETVERCADRSGCTYFDCARQGT